MPKPIRVRFAPSPTGSLHVGGARTALFNWAYARRYGGRFLLRIEDTDPERSTTAFELAILDGLRWLGLDWDEGPDVGGPHAPYHQSQRIARHRELAGKLAEDGHAYRCFCSRDRIVKLNEQQAARKENQAYDGLCRGISSQESAARAAAGETFTLRFGVPEGTTRFFDHVRGEMVFNNKEVEDWVMVRSDGNPTYNFVVVCDDVDMQITHVLRGEEHLVNTPKQVLLYKAFGVEPPEFGHLPLMLGTDRKKLSKRTGDTALQDYRERGFPKEAVVNFLCLQGWALNGTTEIFTVRDLVENFDIKDVNKAGAVFDMDKFLWMAGEYIRSDSLEHVTDMCIPYVIRKGLMTAGEAASKRAWLTTVMAGERERIRTYSEFADRIAYLFVEDDQLVYTADAEKNARKHDGRVDTLKAFLGWIRTQAQGPLDAVALRDAGKLWTQQQGLKLPQLLQPLRCVLTGAPSGADIYDVMQWLAAARTIRRLELGIERLA